MGKRQDNLLAKIAALTETSVEQIRDMRAMYSEEEATLEAQSIANFYHWRKKLERQKGETDRVWEARQHEWHYKICATCDRRFAYAYHYDGVKYCSLDCLVSGLKKIGVQFTPGRPLNLRYGYSKAAVVPSIALEVLEFSLDVQLAHDENGRAVELWFRPKRRPLETYCHFQQVACRTLSTSQIQSNLVVLDSPDSMEQSA